ncbi:cysteine hydrolase [Candidatus Collierbacteria bacterium]|nr:cysteine hydrolase [Candidatus Collierbacteria bacterium]
MDLYQGMTKGNTVLLVIDPVNSCAHEKCETPEWNIHFSKIREMLPKLAKFISDYRKKVGGMVVFITITPWNKENLPDNINELYKDPKALYYSDDNTGFDEQFYCVKPEKEDLVFVKNAYDAFTNKEVVAEFEKRGIRYVVMAGMFTDGCVLATTVNGFSRGYNFVILKDLIETTDDPKRQRLQKLLTNYTFPVLYGKTIAAREFLDSWRR